MPGSDITFAWCFITKQEKKKEKKKKRSIKPLEVCSCGLTEPVSAVMAIKTLNTLMFALCIVFL